MSNQKIVKITTPNWDHLRIGRPKLSDMLPKNQVIGDFKFEINTKQQDCDYWLLFDSCPSKMSVKCPKENVILVTTEAVGNRTYNPRYLSQFSKIITSRNDIKGSHVIYTHYMNCWFVNYNYEELIKLPPPKKTKDISIIASDLTRQSGHKKRYAFVNKLIGHFKDRLDVFGKGFNYIEEKQDALLDYKYSIAIENSYINDYWSEKLEDCYLSYTYPIYYGCPNINSYFNENSITKINIDNWQDSIRIIERVIEADTYNVAKDFIPKAREDVLSKYQFFANISRILKKDIGNVANWSKSKNTILPHHHYLNKIQAKDGIKTGIKSLINLIK